MRSRGASREVRTQVVVSLKPSPPKPLAPRGRLPGPRLWAPYPSRPGGPAPPPLDQRHLASFQVCSWPVPEGDPGCPSPGRVPPPPPRGAGWAQQLHWGRERWGAGGGDGEAEGHLLPLPWQPAWPALSPRYPPNGLHAAAGALVRTGVSPSCPSGWAPPWPCWAVTSRPVGNVAAAAGQPKAVGVLLWSPGAPQGTGRGRLGGRLRPAGARDH